MARTQSHPSHPNLESQDPPSPWCYFHHHHHLSQIFGLLASAGFESRRGTLTMSTREARGDVTRPPIAPMMEGHKSLKWEALEYAHPLKHTKSERRRATLETRQLNLHFGWRKLRGTYHCTVSVRYLSCGSFLQLGIHTALPIPPPRLFCLAASWLADCWLTAGVAAAAQRWYTVVAVRYSSSRFPSFSRDVLLDLSHLSTFRPNTSLLLLLSLTSLTSHIFTPPTGPQQDHRTPLGSLPSTTPKPVRRIELSTDPRGHTAFLTTALTALLELCNPTGNLLEQPALPCLGLEGQKARAKPCAPHPPQLWTADRDRSDDSEREKVRLSCCATATLRLDSLRSAEQSQLSHPIHFPPRHLLPLSPATRLSTSSAHLNLPNAYGYNVSDWPRSKSAQHGASAALPTTPPASQEAASRSPRGTRIVFPIHSHIHPRTLLATNIRHWQVTWSPSDIDPWRHSSHIFLSLPHKAQDLICPQQSPTTLCMVYGQIISSSVPDRTAFVKELACPAHTIRTSRKYEYAPSVAQASFPLLQLPPSCLPNILLPIYGNFFV
ncbi:uncharacterized protein CLUP02_10884 [Colletotrichum lupini]|uniref:Uncharacterized protein n=1 Tax=Colletotrichum lupini TaxID=145971 RepID=A0A9Q8WJS4_9PEZI|nr:uncharacterized protein CLUP02_10884 [Colletotrichum lupini]UQC85387.1 hypothetical protein CLUP02_10884 [Colletotrichum lupini]